MRTHNKRYSRLYRAWADIKNRCLNENVDSFKNYGGRGITFATEFETFDGFYSWFREAFGLDDIPDGLSIDRIDTNGHYVRVTFALPQTKSRRTTNALTAY